MLITDLCRKFNIKFTRDPDLTRSGTSLLDPLVCRVLSVAQHARTIALMEIPLTEFCEGQLFHHILSNFTHLKRLILVCRLRPPMDDLSDLGFEDHIDTIHRKPTEHRLSLDWLELRITWCFQHEDAMGSHLVSLTDFFTAYKEFIQSVTKLRLSFRGPQGGMSMVLSYDLPSLLPAFSLKGLELETLHSVEDLYPWSKHHNVANIEELLIEDASIIYPEPNVCIVYTLFHLRCTIDSSTIPLCYTFDNS